MQPTSPVEDWIQGAGVYGIFDSAGHLIALPVQVCDVLGRKWWPVVCACCPSAEAYLPVGGLMELLALLWCSLKRRSMDRSVSPM
jgi:hypothetical protein